MLVLILGFPIDRGEFIEGFVNQAIHKSFGIKSCLVFRNRICQRFQCLSVQHHKECVKDKCLPEQERRVSSHALEPVSSGHCAGDADQRNAVVLTDTRA